MVAPALPPLSRTDRLVVGGFMLVPTVVLAWGIAIIAPALFQSLPDTPARVVGIAAVVGLGIGAGLLLGRALKGLGGLKNGLSLQNALASGRLPGGADTRIWQAILARQKRNTKRWGWYSAFFVLVAAVYTYLAITEKGPDLGFLTWLAPAGFVAFAAYVPIEARSRERRVNALLEKLDDRDSTAD